jgi:hypothetical protein
VLFEDFERAFGKDDPDLLVWRASSVLMNPSLAARLEQERRLAPRRFEREYEALWIDDVDAFVPPTWVDACVVRGRHELPPQQGVRYGATTDPFGGGGDAWPLHVYHTEGEQERSRLVSDVLRSHRRVGSDAPDLEGIAREYADLLRQYGCDAVCGDKYAAGWVRQAFERRGIRYENAPCDRSAAYVELQPWLAQGRIELLDDPMLVRQLKNLERRPRAGGHDLIDAPRGQHEDSANVVALAVAHMPRGEGTDLGKVLDTSEARGLGRDGLPLPPGVNSQQDADLARTWAGVEPRIGKFKFDF